MKLAVTPFNVASIQKLSDNGAAIFIIGNEQYANRLVSSFSTIEITEVNNFYIRAGNMRWEELDGFWADAGTFESLFDSSDYWRKKSQGEK